MGYWGKNYYGGGADNIHNYRDGHYMGKIKTYHNKKKTSSFSSIFNMFNFGWGSGYGPDKNRKRARKSFIDYKIGRF
jgi:hypothetical protein